MGQCKIQIKVQEGETSHSNFTDGNTETQWVEKLLRDIGKNQVKPKNIWVHLSPNLTPIPPQNTCSIYPNSPNLPHMACDVVNSRPVSILCLA